MADSTAQRRAALQSEPHGRTPRCPAALAAAWGAFQQALPPLHAPEPGSWSQPAQAPAYCEPLCAASQGGLQGAADELGDAAGLGTPLAWPQATPTPARHRPNDWLLREAAAAAGSGWGPPRPGLLPDSTPRSRRGRGAARPRRGAQPAAKPSATASRFSIRGAAPSPAHAAVAGAAPARGVLSALLGTPGPAAPGSCDAPGSAARSPQPRKLAYALQGAAHGGAGRGADPGEEIAAASDDEDPATGPGVTQRAPCPHPCPSPAAAGHAGGSSGGKAWDALRHSEHRGGEPGSTAAQDAAAVTPQRGRQGAPGVPDQAPSSLARHRALLASVLRPPPGGGAGEAGRGPARGSGARAMFAPARGGVGGGLAAALQRVLAQDRGAAASGGAGPGAEFEARALAAQPACP